MTTRNEIENRDAVIDVLLISENRLLREALTKVLVRKSDLRVTSAATCGLEVVRTVDSQRLDVVVVEARMLDQACRGTVLAIMQDRPDVRVLAIGADSDESGFLSGVRAGVAGYLPQDASAAEVAAAVRTVARGGAVCPPKLCRERRMSVEGFPDGNWKFSNWWMPGWEIRRSRTNSACQSRPSRIICSVYSGGSEWAIGWRPSSYAGIGAGLHRSAEHPPHRELSRARRDDKRTLTTQPQSLAG